MVVRKTYVVSTFHVGESNFKENSLGALLFYPRTICNCSENVILFVFIKKWHHAFLKTLLSSFFIHAHVLNKENNSWYVRIELKRHWEQKDYSYSHLTLLWHLSLGIIQNLDFENLTALEFCST